MVRIASATGVPWATRTSTWRSLARISSGLCLFLDMDPSSLGSEAILQGGPLQRGRISPLSRGDARHGESPEWRFVEATQLARVQGRALAAQDVERGKSNLQVLTDGPLIKSAGRARQLDLAMQRLVRDAKQRAVGHTQP